MRWPIKTASEPFWHTWFAWYPVEIGGDWVWLETVWCKRTPHRGGMMDTIIEVEYMLECPQEESHG